MDKNQKVENLEEFKASFSYGKRSDLNFKFLKDLSSEEVGSFFSDLFGKIGETLNDGNINRLVNQVIEWQTSVYSKPGRYLYADVPFSPLQKPLSQSRLALLTSSGHFVAGDDPNPLGVENMTQTEAELRISEFLRAVPQLSEVPIDTPEDSLRVRHGGYDISGAVKDPNVNFPITRLREMQSNGMIGDLFPIAFSFVGACSQLQLTKRSGPAWVKKFTSQGIEGMILVPV